MELTLIVFIFTYKLCYFVRLYITYFIKACMFNYYNILKLNYLIQSLYI
jgi:hypothetical protein